jgi:hypothetical protein
MRILDLHSIHDRVGAFSSHCISSMIDYYLRSCGTFTTVGITSTGPDLLIKECDKNGPFQDTINYCNITPAKDSNGQSLGETHFIKVDCTTGEILPMDQQDPAYNHPGVSTAQGHQLQAMNAAPSKPDSDNQPPE